MWSGGSGGGRELHRIVKRICACVMLFAVFAVVAPTPHGREINNARITCREFLASGQANMARAYQLATRGSRRQTGVIPYQAPDGYSGG